MALSKKTINTHNLKRAEVFAANGLGDHDVAFAHPDFLGEGADDCILCDHKNIKWLFAIRFDVPDTPTMLGKVATGLVRTEEVTLSPIGSKCITDWLDAVPESAAKLEALKRWDKEMKKCNAAKKLKCCEDLCAELLETRGLQLTEETARATVSSLYYKTGYTARSVLSWYDRKRFGANAHKVFAGTCVRKTAQTWIKNLEPVLDEQNKIDAEKAAKKVESEAIELVVPADAPVLDDDLTKLTADNAELIMRARKAWNTGGKDALDDYCQKALTDIDKKVVKYSSFSNGGKQRAFFEKLVCQMEKAIAKANGTEEPEAEAVAVALPGDADFVSASGISGARY